MSRRVAEAISSRHTDSGQPAEDRLRHALAVSGIGIFDHDLVADTIYGSPELLVLYGWRDSATITIQTFLEHTHPEDRELVGSAIRQAHDPSGNGRFELEYQIVRTDGAVRRISARAETHFDGDCCPHPRRTSARVCGSSACRPPW